MRVYEIAREMGVPPKELIGKIRALGLEVNNHMSSLDPDDVNLVRRSMERERLASTETKRLSATVLRRRSSADKPTRRRVGEPSAAVSEPPLESPSVARREGVVTRRTVVSAPAARPPVANDAPSQVARSANRENAAVDIHHVATRAVTPAPAPRANERAAEPRASRSEDVGPATAASDAADKSAQQTDAVRVEAATAATPIAPVASVSERGPDGESAPAESRPAASASDREADQPAAADVPAPSAKPRTPVFIDVPALSATAAAAAAAAAAASAPPPVAASEPERPREATPRRPGKPQLQAHAQGQKPGQAQGAGPRMTLEQVAETARSRFEAELDRARTRVSEREAEERRKRDEETARKADEQRDPSRPAVGSVINLPGPRIKITERPVRPAPGRGQVPSRFADQRRTTRTKREFGRKRQAKKPGKQTQITTPAEHKRIIRMEDAIAIPELAKSMGVKASEVLKKLWGMGMVGVNINATIGFDEAQILASEFGYEVNNVAFKEAEIFVADPDTEIDLIPRAPVVTVMGHVDHGKTSLLDAIRSARVAAGESGGITQHIAAYKVPSGKDYGDIVFLDTPGHEAFTEMRARGAQATDIVVLVVAANDGLMPQTVEALNHAKDAKVAVIVAVNKIDLPDAQPERVRQQLADYALIPEEWGGDTIYTDVSALKREGIDKLLESITLTAEMLELRANPNKPAVGVVIEAKLDRNRGPMATVLVQEGELRVGNTVVAGRYYGKVRALLDHRGKPVQVAGPSTPVELLGLDGVPLAGETVNVADDEKVAKQVVEHRRQAMRKKELAKTSKISLENIMERINEGEQLELKIVLKADVQGSAEALKAALLKQSTDKVKVNVIQATVGGITESDVNLAKAGGAVIIGFHVRPAGKSSKLAEKEGVEIKLYDVIYEALDDVRLAMAGLLAPIKRQVEVGKLEVRDTFTIPKMGTIAGCMVVSGKIVRRSFLRVIRDSIQIYEGKVGSLRRFKDDASEVKEGYECGVMVEGFNDIKVGDIIESYEIVEEAAKL